MEITDIKIRKVFTDKPLKAIVSLTFDNELAVHDVKIIYAKDKLFLIMPSKKNPDGTFKDIIHPINSEFRTKIESKVLKYYDDYMVDYEAQQATASSGSNYDGEETESEE